MTLPQLLLVLALVGLLLGPIAHKWTERSAGLHAAMDGFTVVVIGGLALLELAPNALTHGGALSLVFLAAGFALPMWLHRIGDLGQFSDRILVFFLTVHTAVESAALATADAPSTEALGLAIVAHQLPVGLAAFSLAPSKKVGWLSVCIIALGMVLGFAAGDAAAGAMTIEQGAWLQAMAAGSLLHVLGGHEEPQIKTSPNAAISAAQLGQDTSHGHTHGHAHGHAPHGVVHLQFELSDPVHPNGLLLGTPSPGCCAPAVHPDQRTGVARAFFAALTASSTRTRASFFGGLIGSVLVLSTFLSGHGPEHQEGAFFDAVVDLALESAPAILLGYLTAGLVIFVVTERHTRWLASRGRFAQAVGGVIYGLPLPICSCGILPVFSSLVRKGVPPAASFAFLIATPEIGIDAVLISLPLLGGHLTLIRLAAAGAVALITGWLIARFAHRLPSLDVHLDEPRGKPSLSSALEFGFIELFDHTMPWIVFGLLLAGLLGPLLSSYNLTSFSPWLQVPLFALLGLPLYVCASGATPIAAVAIAHAISPGAALAFLLTGPATNITTFATVERLYGRVVAFLFGGIVFVLAVSSGYIANFLIVAAPGKTIGSSLEHEHGPLTVAALVLLTIFVILSAFRQGPRGLLRQLRPSLA